MQWAVFYGPAYMIKSTDAGNTWTTINLNTEMGRVIDVKFFDANHGFIIGGDNPNGNISKILVLETIDGGNTWIRRYEGPYRGEWGWKIQFLTQQIGFVSIETAEPQHEDSIGNAFLKTINGGLTWERIKFYEDHYSMQGIGFINEQVGWMGSFKGSNPSLGTFDGGKTWQSLGFGNRLNRFRFFSDTLAYVAGQKLYKIRKIK